MENRAQESGMDSVHGASLFSNVLLVAAARMVLPGAGRLALVVMVMALAFSGVILCTLLNLPDTMRRALLVLFATVLLCSGFVALAAWFTVSGASS